MARSRNTRTRANRPRVRFAGRNTSPAWPPSIVPHILSSKVSFGEGQLSSSWVKLECKVAGILPFAKEAQCLWPPGITRGRRGADTRPIQNHAARMSTKDAKFEIPYFIHSSWLCLFFHCPGGAQRPPPAGPCGAGVGFATLLSILGLTIVTANRRRWSLIPQRGEVQS